MVDKVDRPDPVSKYDILPTTETHDEGQRQQEERRDDDEYSTPGTEISWNKFRVATPNRQAVKLQRSDVRQAIFRQALLQSRAAILELDLILTDGRTYQRAQILSSNMDDYWKWKGWVPGQVLPLELMVQGSVLEVNIQIPGSSMAQGADVTGSARLKAPPPRSISKPTAINWLWVAKVGGAVIVILWMIGKLRRWW